MSIWTIYFINLKVYEKKSLQKILKAQTVDKVHM